MNRIRIIGIVMLIIGIVSPLLFKNEGLDFVAGLIGGVGIVLLITGRISFKKKA